MLFCRLPYVVFEMYHFHPLPNLDFDNCWLTLVLQLTKQSANTRSLFNHSGTLCSAWSVACMALSGSICSHGIHTLIHTLTLTHTLTPWPWPWQEATHRMMLLCTVFHTCPSSPLILCHSSLSHILESCLATSPPTTPVLCQLIPPPLISIKLFQIFSDTISPSHSGPMCRAALRQPTKQYLLGQSVVIHSCQVAQPSQSSRYNYIFQGLLHSKLAGHLDTADELSPLLTWCQLFASSVDYERLPFFGIMFGGPGLRAVQENTQHNCFVYHTHSHTHLHTHTLTLTHMQTHTHTNTHSHAHTLKKPVGFASTYVLQPLQQERLSETMYLNYLFLLPYDTHNWSCDQSHDLSCGCTWVTCVTS